MYPAPGQPSVAADQKQLGPFTLWPCQHLLKSVTDVVTCLQKTSSTQHRDQVRGSTCGMQEPQHRGVVVQQSLNQHLLTSQPSAY